MSIVVIIGPSGAGKSTVARELQMHHGFHLQRTVTTRPKRNEHDVDHIFVNEETYESMERSNAFFGELPDFGYKYGLPKFDASERTLLLLRAPATKEFIAKFTNAIVVQLEAPFATLSSRLIARGSEDRLNAEALAQEVALGRTMAISSFDSSRLTPEEIASRIATLVEQRAVRTT